MIWHRIIKETKYFLATDNISPRKQNSITKYSRMSLQCSFITNYFGILKAIKALNANYTVVFTYRTQPIPDESDHANPWNVSSVNYQQYDKMSYVPHQAEQKVMGKYCIETPTLFYWQSIDVCLVYDYRLF